MTLTEIRCPTDATNNRPDSQADLCYAGGMGLLGLAIGFLLTIGTFIVLWSIHATIP